MSNHKKKKIKIFSDAFPPNELGERQKRNPISTTHLTLKEIKIDPNLIIYKPLTKDNINEILILHREWFPIDYETTFFEKTLNPEEKNFFSIGAFYKINNKEIIIGSSLCEIQEIDKKFLYHTSEDTLNKISKNISFFEEISYTFGFNNFHCFYIMTIGVIDECRSLHIGKKMLELIKKKALEDPFCVCIYLDVIFYNKIATIFYKKNNFEESSIIRNYYNLNGKYYDSFVYVHILTSSEKKEFRKKNESFCSKFWNYFFFYPFYLFIDIVTINLFCKCLRRKNKKK